MNCPQCQLPAEPDAAFCGNCGQALQLVAAMPTAEAAGDAVHTAGPSDKAPLPAYAVAAASPERQQLESKAMTGLIISVLAVPGALIPVLGASLAVAGLIMATTARGIHKTMRNLSLAFASVAVALSVGVYVWSLQQAADTSRQAQAGQGQANGGADGQLQADNEAAKEAEMVEEQVFETPCYSLAMAGLDFSESSRDSCKLWMRNAVNLADASNAYSVDAVMQQQVTAENLAATGRQLADTYIKSSMPGFTVTSQSTGSFAESQAYLISGSNTSNVTMQMALVLRPVTHGENLFVIVHATSKGKANVANLEADWKWK